MPVKRSPAGCICNCKRGHVRGQKKEIGPHFFIFGNLCQLCLKCLDMRGKWQFPAFRGLYRTLNEIGHIRNQ